MTTAADGAATNGGVPKNAGTYYVKAVVPENGNYAGAEAETFFTIAPLPADLTWSKTDLIYTGSEQSVSATVANALEGDSFAIAYEGNTRTEAGDSYTATVTDLGNDNYTLTGATGVSQNWSISYLQSSAAAQVSGTKGNNDWYISPVKLVPDSGYQISTDKTDWKDSLGDYTDQGEQSAGYYLKETATGAVTDKKTVTFKIDTGMPSGSIRIGEKTFDSSLKDVTYGYWFKDNVSVDITGADSASGIASVEYQAVSAEESYDANGTWLPWNAAEKLSLTESGRYVVYARVTDKAGNQTIVNSDGVVVFKDSVVVDSSIDYTRTTKASVDAKVKLNGNTIASVRNGETTLTEGKDYTVSADRITFSGEYLDTLKAGTYKLTVAYHLQGVTEYKGGDKPADSQIAVNVSRQTANIKITGTLDKEYDGQPADLVYTTNSDASVKTEYKVNGTWQTEAPIHAGTYEVRVSVSENGDFTAASDTKAYTIRQREVVVSGITAKGGIYEGTITPATAVLDGLVGEDDPEIILTYAGRANDGTEVNGTEAPSLAGTYIVTATITDSNYSLKEDGSSAEFTIKRADPQLSVSAVKDKKYGEEAFKLEVSNKGDGVKSYVSSDDKVVRVDNNGVVTIVGAGTATLTVSLAESANYTADQKEVTVAVGKIEHSLVVDKISYRVTYGDPAFKITAKAGDKESGIQFASDNKEVATVSKDGTVNIGNAGTAKITVSMDESQNYLAVSREVTVTVVPKNITVTADNKNKIAGKADPVLTYTAKGLVGKDTLSGITVKRKAGKKVGNYPITVSQAVGSNPNYRITFRKGIFTIEQADQSKLSGKAVYRLKLPVFFATGKAQKNSIVVSWKKYTGAAGYDVFWRYCDGSIKYKKVGTVKNGKLSMTHKNLKSNREYKYFVVAYKMVKGRKIYIAKSNGMHVAMKQARTTNAVSIKVNRTTVILKAGKTFRLKCQLTGENRKKKLLSHLSYYRYYTTSSKIATVSQNGVIRANAKGSCSIYVLANNGVYKKVTVKVK